MDAWTALAGALVQAGGFPDISDAQAAAVLGGFAAAVAGIFLYLARDSILRRRGSYDAGDLGSKKDRTYEKYHSGWGDDYEEVGGRPAGPELKDGEPDHYMVLGLPRGATREEIRARFRELAKEEHPDRSGGDPARMAEINRAYEVLSDERSKKRYDSMTGG